MTFDSFYFNSNKVTMYVAICNITRAGSAAYIYMILLQF